MGSCSAKPRLKQATRPRHPPETVFPSGHSTSHFDCPLLGQKQKLTASSIKMSCTSSRTETELLAIKALVEPFHHTICQSFKFIFVNENEPGLFYDGFRRSENAQRIVLRNLKIHKQHIEFLSGVVLFHRKKMGERDAEGYGNEPQKAPENSFHRLVMFTGRKKQKWVA
jgi:hypothetical protein